MALAYSTTLRNAQLDAITTAIGSSGLLRIYDGTRPSTGGTATTLLAELALSTTAAGSAASGVLTFSAITSDTSANATGTATWFRLLKSDGTTICFDGSVSTVAAGTGDMRLDDTSIVLGGTVAISSATITEGNA